MRFRRGARVLAGFVAGSILAVGCSEDDRAITVIAAASLVDAFEVLAPLAEQEGFRPAFVYTASPAAVEQVRQGAPADVIVVADPELLDELVRDGVIEGSPVVFARNPLVLAVRPGTGVRVERLEDLVRSDLRVALGAPTVPVGRLARDLLEDRGLLERVSERVVTSEADSRGVVAKLALGEVDAAIVYAADARNHGLTVADGPYEEFAARYAAAVVSDALHLSSARRYVELLTSPRFREALSGAGFLEP